MSKIVVFYYFGYGYMKKIVEVVVGVVGVQLMFIDVEGNFFEVDWVMLVVVDGIVFGILIYMGGLSWQFKKFVDVSSKFWYVQVWKDKIVVGFINFVMFNGDKQGMMQYLYMLSQQYGMIWVGMGLKVFNYKVVMCDDVNNFGGYVGFIIQILSDVLVEEMVLGDFVMVKYFGECVKVVVDCWMKLV